MLYGKNRNSTPTGRNNETVRAPTQRGVHIFMAEKVLSVIVAVDIRAAEKRQRLFGKNPAVGCPC